MWILTIIGWNQLLYLKEFCRGKLMKFWLGDENFPGRIFYQINIFFWRILSNNWNFLEKATKFWLGQKSFEKFAGKCLPWGHVFSKVPGLSLELYQKKIRLQVFFSTDFGRLFGTVMLLNTSGRLFLARLNTTSSKIFINPNLGGLFRGLFWGARGLKLIPCLKVVRAMQETC